MRFLTISFALGLQLAAKGLSDDVTMKIPHYLKNSRLFCRFNESGGRMKSDGQSIWRAHARYRNGIPGTEAPANGTFHHHSPSVSSPQQQQQHDGTTNGLTMAADPLPWEFLPYQRSIIGPPPPAIVGRVWQWNIKIHDPWSPRKQVSWSCSSTSSDTENGLVHDESDPPFLLSALASSSSSIALPRWLSLQGSQLKGTPTEPGIHSIVVEATFQDDKDPEPIVVRGNYAIQVFKAITGREKKSCSSARWSEPPA
jgi:hypothetical protein